MRIAIVGAPGSGAQQLLQDLPAALSQAALPEACTVSAPPIPLTAAASHLAACDLTLLCALNAMAATPEARDREAQLREALQALGTRFAVLYGDAEVRLQTAVQAITHAQRAARRLATGDTLWQWSCEKCSDADCEHRLFSRLLPTDSVRP
jgi:hypothetical protein